MSGLLTSILHRPYVFAFLIAYLILASRLWGWRRALLWLISGYFIAWVSEFSSINNGFPYGEYHYVYENLTGELLIAGVPFFDSLSYPFLIFAGYSTAEYLMKPQASNFEQGLAARSSRLAAIVGALLTMLLDVIIDPIATMGDKWFLGKIHWYAHTGWYFGVPATNFAGWFLVATAVIVFNALAWHTFPTFFAPRTTHHASRRWLYPAFYAGIALFNIAITFWVGEWRLGAISSCILCAISALAIRAAYKELRCTDH